jgi:hypothetical protein
MYGTDFTKTSCLCDDQRIPLPASIGRFSPKRFIICYIRTGTSCPRHPGLRTPQGVLDGRTILLHIPDSSQDPSHATLRLILRRLNSFGISPRCLTLNSQDGGFRISIPPTERKSGVHMQVLHLAFRIRVSLTQVCHSAVIHKHLRLWKSVKFHVGFTVRPCTIEVK